MLGVGFLSTEHQSTRRIRATFGILNEDYLRSVGPEQLLGNMARNSATGNRWRLGCVLYIHSFALYYGLVVNLNLNIDSNQLNYL